VILSANYNDKGLPVEDLQKRWRIEEDVCGLYLVVPTNAAMASVIDDQHLLLGFDHAEDARKTIGVQALFDRFRIVAQSTNPLKLEEKLSAVIDFAREVDFADQLFQESGKGRERVKK
jgi:hypothetical protein